MPGQHITFLLILLMLAGCAKHESAPAPTKTFVWDTNERPYDVIGVGESNVPKIGDQARTAQAIYAKPEKRDDVEQAVLEIYRELKHDIEEVQPDAKYRRIAITVFDAPNDIQFDRRAWICSLSVFPKAGDALPDQPTELIEWQWRDPSARPTREEREIEWQYLKELDSINAGVQFPITDGELVGMRAAERRKYIEQRYKYEVEDLQQELSQTHGMSVEELQELLDRTLQWKYAEETIAGASTPTESDSQTDASDPPAAESTDAVAESVEN